MLATIAAASLLGVTGHTVHVEVHVGRGLPSFTMVGLPDASCREARDRVRAALLSSGLTTPTQRVTVNLAPSSLPKLGTGLDLAVAVGLLGAAGEVPTEATSGVAFLGELGLDGSLRPVRGVVPLVAGLAGVVPAVVVPTADAGAASVVPGVEVRGASSLAPWSTPFAVTHRGPTLPSRPTTTTRRPPISAMSAVNPSPASPPSSPPPAATTFCSAARPAPARPCSPDGSPGSCPTSPMPPPSRSPASTPLPASPPATAWCADRRSRAPHHTASAVSLVGGGTAAMRPGEVSCAHRGVLFCDELGEFAPSVIDALRQPLEEGVVRVCRARGSMTYPAAFQFVAATNPCPCGPVPSGCRCTTVARARYLRRLSGPLLDRFDLRVDVARPDATDLLSDAGGEPTALVASRVAAARARAIERGVAANASLPTASLRRWAPLAPESRRLLGALVGAGTLSGRGVHRVRRVARTVADLAGDEGPLTVEHVSTALVFRAALDPGGLEVAS